QTMKSENSSNDPLVIHLGLDSTGAVYVLHPLSRARVEESFPEAQGLPKVFLGFKKADDFERLHKPLWELVGSLLTGLNGEQSSQLGGLRIYNPRNQQVVWESQPQAVTTK